MRDDRPIKLNVDLSDSEEEMQTNQALYTLMKKLNLKLRKYAKDNRSVKDASRLFDITPLVEDIRYAPQFTLPEDDPRNMAPAFAMFFRFLNNLLSELKYYAILHIEDDYDRFLHYRITLNKLSRILIVNDTGERYTGSPYLDN